jgi:two-component system nitrogen regulation response regulator NtrX
MGKAKRPKGSKPAPFPGTEVGKLEDQLEMAQAQLMRYAEELNQLYLAEKERRKKLEASFKDLRKSHRASERARQELAAQLNPPLEDIIGSSKAVKDIIARIDQVAPTESKILITGENGTGKELVARSIVVKSRRVDQPFFIVNCAAIPEELIESELFGHEKGAFTGAAERRLGKFELANNGTLFLDEVGDMSFKTQAKVLRAIETGGFERVGGKETLNVDVRIIAATNKDLEAMVREETFREDLYYRINVIRFHVTPLRERRKDIALLARHFIKDICAVNGKPLKALSSEAIRVLTEYPWPGNVRELRNVVERLVILAPEDVVLAKDVLEALPPGERTEGAEGLSFRDARASFEKQFLVEALRANDWNVSATAKQLDLNRSYLHTKLRSYGISTEDSQE